ncbi:alpha-galactosidase [Enterococcus sp. JM9B]|uniref:alpha-galactosidase n=1 Tax=Enterococcus sp. JM9B TaxID=1857216 RepID=UPI001374B147|nr:alpha-galactosidase [Enterococcus sp. JM9B]KAF1300823.1 alpha-galactosidase [Enterococcus sp. JM9B]
MDCKVIKQLELRTKSKQISLGVLESGHVCLLYFGDRLAEKTELSYVIRDIQRASYLSDTDGERDFRLEQLPIWYPAFGNPDLREPAFQIEYENGSRISDFRFYKANYRNQKSKIPGLPSTFSEKAVTTLEIILKDALTENRLHFFLSAFEEYDMFTQSIQIVNDSRETIKMTKATSLSLDLLDDRFEMLTLVGAWGREMQLRRTRLQQGFQGVDSKRGASGHGQNPFIALVRPETDDYQGEVIAANLVYSGNFIAEAIVDMHQNTRLQMGLHSFDFQWDLAPKESFYTPEIVFTHTNQGVNKMTQLFQHFYLDCLINPNFTKKARPVLLNNWEATYFNFNRQKLLALGREATKLGIELFVLDDGWFGERNSIETSIGDWQPNEKKLGSNLQLLIQEFLDIGLDFGLWIEPEMVSPKSQLFTEHPEWIIQVENRKPQLSRTQYVLDLSQPAVQDFIIQTIKKILSENRIRYLKWDMNRNITDSGSTYLVGHQKELGHRYILGLYRILSEITTAFPDVLIESCAGGGGRFDPGMLAYTPQIWISDDTDAVQRLSIQQGAALIYPNVCIGCHVSAVPNHQVGRMTSLHTRGVVAFQGNLGYELDLTTLEETEKQQIAQQIEHYKRNRQLLQFGKYSRVNTFDENATAWMKEDEQHLWVSYVSVLAKPNTVPKRLKLPLLVPEQRYMDEQGNDYSGTELMTIGLPIPQVKEDFIATEWRLSKSN